MSTPHQAVGHYNPRLDVLLGRRVASIDKTDDTFRLDLTDGSSYELLHEQDCCESVTLEDVAGDLGDLIGEPLVMASLAESDENPPEHADSHTWSFYKFATVRGYVTLRWLGESNGYYSESVDFRRRENWTDTRPQGELDGLDVEADAAEFAGDMAGATAIRAFRAEFTPMDAGSFYSPRGAS